MIQAPMLVRWLLRPECALTVLGVLLGIAGATLFLLSVDGPALVVALSAASWWWAPPVLALGCLNFWLRVLRWNVLLGPRVGIGNGQLMRIGLKASLVGLVLPARGGDLVKIALAMRVPNLTMPRLAAAELLERSVDGVILGAFITAAAVTIGDSQWLLLGGSAALVAHLLIFAALPLAERIREQARDLASCGWIRRLAIQAVEAVRLTNRPQILRALGLSILAWSAQALACFCIAIAFGWLPSPALPFATVGVTNFAFGLPGGPAGVGTVEFPLRQLMDRFGAEPGLASAYPMVMHLSTLAPLPVLSACILAARWRPAWQRSFRARG